MLVTTDTTMVIQYSLKKSLILTPLHTLVVSQAIKIVVRHFQCLTNGCHFFGSHFFCNGTITSVCISSF